MKGIFAAAAAVIFQKKGISVFNDFEIIFGILGFYPDSLTVVGENFYGASIQIQFQLFRVCSSKGSLICVHAFSGRLLFLVYARHIAPLVHIIFPVRNIVTPVVHFVLQIFTPVIHFILQVVFPVSHFIPQIFLQIIYIVCHIPVIPEIPVTIIPGQHIVMIVNHSQKLAGSCAQAYAGYYSHDSQYYKDGCHYKAKFC